MYENIPNVSQPVWNVSLRSILVCVEGLFYSRGCWNHRFSLHLQVVWDLSHFQLNVFYLLTQFSRIVFTFALIHFHQLLWVKTIYYIEFLGIQDNTKPAFATKRLFSTIKLCIALLDQLSFRMLHHFYRILAIHWEATISFSSDKILPMGDRIVMNSICGGFSWSDVQKTVFLIVFRQKDSSWLKI